MEELGNARCRGILRQGLLQVRVRSGPTNATADTVHHLNRGHTPAQALRAKRPTAMLANVGVECGLVP